MLDSSPEGHIAVAVCRLLPDDRKHVRLAMVTGANADPLTVQDRIVVWAGRKIPKDRVVGTVYCRAHDR